VATKDIHSEKHPEHFLLKYAENSLDPQDKAAVSAHVAACKSCSDDVNQLRDIIGNIKSNRLVFCPASSELFDWVQNDNQLGPIADHLNYCEACRNEAREYSPLRLNEQIPSDLLNSLIHAQSVKPPSLRASLRDSGGDSWWQRILDSFRVRSFALGSAVVILFAVLLYPYFVQDSHIIGLSSEKWEQQMKPKSVRPKAAILILKDQGPTISQNEIDNIYRAVQPRIDISEKLDVISPAEISKAVYNKELNADSKQRLLSDLHEKFAVSTAILIAITQQNGKSNAVVEKINTKNGEAVEKKVVSIAQNNFDQLREVIKTLLLSASD
jgi:hypothetical protein